MNDLETNLDYVKSIETAKQVAGIIYEKHKSERLASIKLSKLNALEAENSSLREDYEEIIEKEYDQEIRLSVYEKVRKEQIARTITLNNIHILILKINLYGENYENKTLVNRVSENTIFELFNKENIETTYFNNVMSLDNKLYVNLTNNNSLYEQETIYKGLILNSSNKIIALISKTGIMVDPLYNSKCIVENNDGSIQFYDNGDVAIDDYTEKNIIGYKDTSTKVCITAYNNLGILDNVFYVITKNGNKIIEGLYDREQRYANYLIERGHRVW